LAMMAKKTKS
jgi:calcium-dependent protein kinase